MNLRPPLAAVAALLLVVPCAAQDSTDAADEQAARHDLLVERFEASMQRMMIRFWEPRVNRYKESFDAIVTPHDLVGLNELRVRFTMLLESTRNEGRERGSADTHEESTVDTSVSAAEELAEEEPGSGIDTAGIEPAESVAVDEVGPDEYDMSEEAAAEYERELVARREREMDEREAALARGDAGSSRPWFGQTEEYVELPLISHWLAHRYRAALEPVAESFYRDLRAFNDSLKMLSEEFQSSHAMDIAADPTIVESIEERAELAGIDRLLRHRRVLAETYRNEIEPMLLLYDGGGLTRFVESMTRVALEATPDAAELLTGSSPNPASTSVTISYTLPQPSRRTVLRLYDGHGDGVLDLEQGPQGTGEHAATLDVSTLASGPYLCQLTVSLASGPRTSSMLIQVTR